MADENKNGDLRLVWISKGKPFYRKVDDLEQAKFIVGILTDYDLFLGELIAFNSFDLEEYSDKPIDGENWTTWYNLLCEDFSEVVDGLGVSNETAKDKNILE